MKVVIEKGSRIVKRLCEVFAEIVLHNNIQRAFMQ